MAAMNDMTRRTALLTLASGGGVALAAACRPAGRVEDQAIRAWFRERYALEIDDAALPPIRDYLQRSVTPSDPGLQPPILFDPEVDAG
jgi:hypothetical protein